MTETSQDTEGLLSPLLSRWRLGRVVRYIGPGDRVLDCGCGSGRLLGLLPEDCSYVGIDLVSDVFPTDPPANARFLALSLLSEEAHKQLTALGPFDVIVLAAVLEHFDDPANLLQAMRRHLDEGGRLIVTTPSPRIRAIHGFGGRLGIFSRHGAKEHKVLLGSADLCNVADAAGLNVLSYQTFQLGLNQLVVLDADKGQS